MTNTLIMKSGKQSHPQKKNKMSETKSHKEMKELYNENFKDTEERKH